MNLTNDAIERIIVLEIYREVKVCVIITTRKYITHC